MNSNQGVTFDLDGISWSTYNVADFIHDLKKNIPSSERSYDPDVKVWWISDAYTIVLKNLILSYGVPIYV